MKYFFYNFIFISLFLTCFGQGLFAQPCNIIEVVLCGNSNIFAPGSGSGDAAYGNGLGSSCYSNPGAGGKEQIYKFKASQSGTYQFQTLSSSPVVVEYFYKTGGQDPCLGTGWTCLGYTSGAIALDAINLNQNDSIWVLANSESATTAANHSFQIQCAIPFACESIQSMECGIPQSFSLGSGFGDPLFYNGLGTSCYNNSGQGGGEAMYQFTAVSTGTYFLEVTANNSGGIVEYFYKSSDLDPCSASGWNCLGYRSTPGALDAINLTAGESLYILVNAESATTASSQNFQVRCAVPYTCESISPIDCGVETTVVLDGVLGNPEFYNGLGTSCYNNSGQGAGEAMFQFTASEAGTYFFEVTAYNSGGTVEYFYKSSTADPCDAAGWICLGYRSSPGALDAINLEAGESIFILANAESSTTGANQSFLVRCVVPFACSLIQQLSCGEEVVFTSEGILGNPEFYNGIGTSCYNNSGQGGQESIFQFTAEVDGTYQFRTTSVGSGVVEYFYKSASLNPCENFGWICLGYTSSVTNLDAINLIAGESIWLLVNSESTTIPANQIFVVDCAVPFACTEIEEIQCGVAVVFNPGAGLGNPDYYNGLGTSCYNNSGQGGRERIYSFTAPTSGTYLFETMNVGQPTFVDYLYKSSNLNPCENFGWNCLGYTGSVSYLDGINLNAGESIWLCVNAETALGAHQVFQVRCAQPFACNAMEQITCGSVITYQSVGGYGNPLFHNGLGSSCYSSSGQGGTEKIYQFVAPETGIFSFSVTNVPAGGVFEYFTLAGNLDPCVNSGWQCLNYRSTPGALGTRTLNEGELIYILVNTESLVSYAQSWQVACVTSAPVTINAAQTNVVCHGLSSGSIDLSISGGVAPYTYDWLDISGINNVEDRTGLAEGVYTVTVTDSEGTEATQNFTVTEAPALQIISNITPPSAPGGSDGSIALILVGVPGPYNTDWDDMLGTNNPEDRTNLNEGQYCVTITDANACTSNYCFNVAIGADPLSVEATIVNPLCVSQMNGSITLVIAGGIAPYVIDWADVAGVDNLTDRINLGDGIYTVTVSDNAGSSVTQDFSVNEPLPLVMSAIVTNATSICANDGAILPEVGGGIAPYTFEWIDTTYTGSTWSGLQPGEYCLEVTDGNGCSVDDCFVVEGSESYLIFVESTVQNPLCYNEVNGSIDLIAENGCEPYTYDWQHIPGSDDPASVSGLAPGFYEVTITDINGVEFNGAYTLSNPAELTISATVEPVTVQGGSDGAVSVIVSGGAGGYTFDWNDLTGGGQLANRINLSAGEYCVVATDANGCDVSACFVVEEEIQNELEVNVMQSDVSCFNGSNGFISLNVSGGTEPYDVDWGDLPGLNNGLIRENLTAGTYSVTIFDQNGNMYENSFLIEQPTVLSIDGIISDASSISDSDGAIDIAISGGVGPYTFNWSHLSFQDEPEDIDILLPGDYCVEVIDYNGCVIVDCFEVSYSINLGYSITDVSCAGLDNGSILIDVTGGTEPYQFDWADIPGIDMVENRFNVQAGTYVLTITDAMDITDEFIFVVGEPSLLQVFTSFTDASNQTAADGTVSLNVLGGTPPYQFDWADLAGTTDPEDRSGLLPGQYCVTVQDDNLCEWTGCVDVGFDVGMNEITNDMEWSFYPNPSGEAIRLETISGKLPDRIEITDVNGRMVFSSNEKTGILLLNLKAGVYNLRVFFGDYSSVKRLVRL